MSSEAWVICRVKPSIPPEGEIDDGAASYWVQPTDAEGLRVLSQQAPHLAAAELRWTVIIEVTGDWFDSFEAAGRALARRCGGGVLWSPVWEGRGVDAIIVEPCPDATVGGRWTLSDALNAAFYHQADWDEAEWREEVCADDDE
jgi:hypothetical protein